MIVPSERLTTGLCPSSSILIYGGVAAICRMENFENVKFPQKSLALLILLTLKQAIAERRS